MTRIRERWLRKLEKMWRDANLDAVGNVKSPCLGFRSPARQNHSHVPAESYNRLFKKAMLYWTWYSIPCDRALY
jgi:hypothetical protein